VKTLLQSVNQVIHITSMNRSIGFFEMFKGKTCVCFVKVLVESRF